MNLVVLQGFVLAGGILAALLGVILYRRLPQWGPIGRIGVVFLPLLAFFGVGEMIMQLVDAPYANWNPPRLAPAFALWHGYAMYYGPDHGPVLGNIYGPGLALAYLPTVIFPLPSLALKFGVLLTSGYYFLPVVSLHCMREERDRRCWALAGMGIVWFMFITVLYTPLSYIAFSIHADAPAVSLCGLACVFLYGKTGRHSWRTFLPAAICSALAVWTKQTMVPILIALPLYLWLAEGRRTCLNYLKYLAVGLGLISVVFTIWLGSKPLWFNLFVIPGHHPWYPLLADSPVEWLRSLRLPAKVSVLLEAAAQLIEFCLVPLSILVAYFIYKYRFSVAKLTSLRSWFTTQSWTLPALVGLCMVPTSLLGRVKVGGDINSLSFATYFIFLAASLVLVQAGARICALEFQGSTKQVRNLTFCTLLVFTVSIYSGSRFSPHRVGRPGPNFSDQAFRFLQAHPGECYFPWDPLVHLMAEKKLYHFCYGVFDRELAGYPLSPEHLRSGLPPQLKWVIFAGGADRTYSLKYLPEFDQPDMSFLEELPSCISYRRK